MLPGPVPDDDNAAILIERARALITGDPNPRQTTARGVFAEIESQVFAIEETSTPEASSWTSHRVSRLSEPFAAPEVERVFALLHAAAAKPRYFVPRDGVDPLNEFRPDIGMLRGLIRLLTQRARTHATLGVNREMIWQDLAAAQGIAAHSSDIPGLMGAMMTMAGAGIVNDAALHVIERDLPPRDPAAYAQILLTSLPKLERSLLTALHFERLASLAAIEERYVRGEGDWFNDLGKAGALSPSPPKWLFGTLSPWISRVARPQLAADLTHAQRYYLQASLLAADFASGRAERWLSLKSDSTDALLSVAELPIASIARSHVVSVTRQHSWIIFMSALVQRDERGTLPDSITALSLSPEITLDPCSGLPIVYRREGDELLIYAAGCDGDDDGGRPTDPRKAIGDGDVVLRVRVAR